MNQKAMDRQAAWTISMEEQCLVCTSWQHLAFSAPPRRLARPYFGLFVHPFLPVKDAGELAALAKKRPGKLSYGSYGVGTATHLMTEHFKAVARIDIIHIPYKGSVAAQLGLINNDVQLIFDGVGNASAHVKSGKIRMIGVASNTRTPASPGTPTLTESGVPYVYESGFFAIFAPAGTPKEVVMTLNRELVKAVKEPELRNWFAGQAYEVVGSPPEELGEVVRTQLEVFRKLVREVKIKAD
jgi:tripartite-type tricarboxylate transporter receptor subunit TctC